MELFNTWQFNLVGYIFFAVIFNQFYKLAVQSAKHEGAATLVLQAIGCIGALFFVPFFPMIFPTDWKVYGLLVIACIFYAINDRLQTDVRKNLEVSVSTLINQLSTVFLIIFGFTVFREPFSLIKVVGALLIVGANILLQYKGKKIVINKYMWVAVIANLAMALAVSIDVGISKQFNLPIYIMLTLLMPMIIIKFTERTTVKSVIEEFSHGNKTHYIITGVSWSLIILCMLRAYQFGSFTVITPLSSVSVLINILVATIFFSERDHMIKKLIAAIMVIGGVYLTVLT